MDIHDRNCWGSGAAFDNGMMPGGAAHSCSVAAVGRIFARPILLQKGRKNSGVLSEAGRFNVKANVRPCHVKSVRSELVVCRFVGLWFECTNCRMIEVSNQSKRIDSRKCNKRVCFLALQAEDSRLHVPFDYPSSPALVSCHRHPAGSSENESLESPGVLSISLQSVCPSP